MDGARDQRGVDSWKRNGVGPQLLIADGMGIRQRIRDAQVDVQRVVHAALVEAAVVKLRRRELTRRVQGLKNPIAPMCGARE